MLPGHALEQRHAQMPKALLAACTWMHLQVQLALCRGLGLRATQPRFRVAAIKFTWPAE